MDLDAFTTRRLFAERLRPDHLPEIRRMHQDPRVMANLGGLRDDDESLAYLERNLEHWDRYGFGIWIVTTPDREVVVGRACVRHLDVAGAPEVEIGYALYPDWWGQGLATEIATKCVDIGRDRLGLDTVVAITRPTNQASRHVMQKVGMAYEREVVLEGAKHVMYRTQEDGPGGGDETK